VVVGDLSPTHPPISQETASSRAVIFSNKESLKESSASGAPGDLEGDISQVLSREQKGVWGAGRWGLRREGISTHKGMPLLSLPACQIY